jgi:hypothetical protein
MAAATALFATGILPVASTLIFVMLLLPIVADSDEQDAGEA